MESVFTFNVSSNRNICMCTEGTTPEQLHACNGKIPFGATFEIPTAQCSDILWSQNHATQSQIQKLNHHATSNSPSDSSTSKIAQNLMFFAGTSPPGVERESRRLGSVQTARTSTSSNSAQIRVFYPNPGLSISETTLVLNPAAASLLTSTLMTALCGSIVCTSVEPGVRKLRIQGINSKWERG